METPGRGGGSRKNIQQKFHVTALSYTFMKPEEVKINKNPFQSQSKASVSTNINNLQQKQVYKILDFKYQRIRVSS